MKQGFFIWIPAATIRMLRILMPRVLVQGILMLGVLAACSCSTETALQQLMASSAASPVFQGCKAVAGGDIQFYFSTPVKVLSMYFEPPLETELLGAGETLTLRIKTELPGGEKVTADLLVEDEKGNTLNVLFPFRTRNTRPPDLVINEIRTDYSNSGGKLRAEFIEIKALSSGSLGALRLFAAFEKGGEPLWEFPPAEVKAGEYIVLHTRNREGGVNETDGRLAASGGADAAPDARDFWTDREVKLHSVNAFYLMDQDDRILEGVLIHDSTLSSKDSAARDNVERAAENMRAQGAWNGDPVNADKTTATATICRDETKADTNGAADWYVTASSSATPGKTNSEKRAK
ncbi:MAG: hypothetical protein LBQ44_02860 [Treponema sp.]|jgi:hypothetical protein|nr:hypothetical protein [Treponema sp.]